MEIRNNTSRELGLPDGSTLAPLGKTKVSQDTWEQWAYNPVMRAWLDSSIIRPVIKPKFVPKADEPESTPSWRDRFGSDSKAG